MLSIGGLLKHKVNGALVGVDMAGEGEFVPTLRLSLNFERDEEQGIGSSRVLHRAQVEIELLTFCRSSIGFQVSELQERIRSGIVLKVTKQRFLNSTERKPSIGCRREFAQVLGRKDPGLNFGKDGVEVDPNPFNEFSLHGEDAVDGTISLLAERTVEEAEKRTDDLLADRHRKGDPDRIHPLFGVVDRVIPCGFRCFDDGSSNRLNAIFFDRQDLLPNDLS